jgi:hypothetical protein
VRRAGIRLAVGIAAAASLAVAAPAGAAVTIGQLQTGALTCDQNTDAAQTISPPSGSSYVVPGTGTITSWSTQAGPGATQSLAMKVFRKVGDPARFQAVGHDGPRTLSAGALNTFPTSVRVRPGDLLGLHTTATSVACLVVTPGAQIVFANGTDLADGASDDFVFQNGAALNIQATFVPDNTFTRGKVKRNKNNGTATVTLNLPNPGQLTGSGGGAKVAAGAVTSKAVQAGQAKIVIRAKGKKKATLNANGKVKVKPKVTYTPTGGDPGIQKLKLKLLKR